MPSDETKPDFGWLQKIGSEIAASNGDLILAGHSLGASMLLKYLSENELRRNVTGVLLIATPFWSGDEDWVQGLKLSKDFARTFPKDIPAFFYHCHDDEEVPFDTLAIYKQKLPHAVIRPIEKGGHQLDSDLSAVAEDIKSL
jgi:predicted alpha/beta hydrolase family esterase